MQTVENVSEETRVWPALQRADGTTLELDPGESAEVEDLPEDFEDAHLKATAPPSPPSAYLNDEGQRTTTQEPTR